MDFRFLLREIPPASLAGRAWAARGLLLDAVAAVAAAALAAVAGWACFSYSAYYSFWVDEAWRAIVFGEFHGDFSHGGQAVSLTPGYLLLGAGLARLHDVEAVLRLSSSVPTFLAILLGGATAWLWTRSRGLTLAALSFFCWNTQIISYAKQLKPYGLDLLLHAGFLFLVVGVLRWRKPRWAAAAAAWAFLFPWVSPTCVFGLPGGLLAMAWAASGRDADRAFRRWVGIAWAAAAFSLACQYFLFWHPNAQSAADLAASFGGGLYPGHSLAGYPAWFLDTLKENLRVTFASGDPLWNRVRESTLRHAVPKVCLFSLAILAVRRPTVLLLVLVPLLGVIALNFLQKWPWSIARMNLFLTPYLIFGVVAAFREVRLLLGAPVLGKPGPVLVAAVGAMGVWVALAEVPRNCLVVDREGPPIQDMRTVLEHLIRERAGPSGSRPAVVIPVGGGVYSVPYYSRLHARTAPAWQALPPWPTGGVIHLPDDLTEEGPIPEMDVPPGGEACLLYSHMERKAILAMPGALRHAGYRIVEIFNAEGAGYIRCIAPPPAGVRSPARN